MNEHMPERTSPVFDKFGDWMLDTVDRVLVHVPSLYRVDFLAMGTCAGMLDTIFQVESKGDISAKDLGDFVRAMSTIFRPQQTLCSNGIEKSFDAEQHFNRVLKEGYPPRGRPGACLDDFR